MKRDPRACAVYSYNGNLEIGLRENSAERNEDVSSEYGIRTHHSGRTGA